MPARRIGGLQNIAFQNHEEKILRQILRILGRIAPPIDECENGAPINLTELGQAFVAVAPRPGRAAHPDQTPPRGGEMRQCIASFRRLGYSFHALSVP